MRKSKISKILMSVFALLLFMTVVPKVHAEKTYTIGTDVTYPPFEFANKDNKYVGIDVDLLKAIAKEEGFKVNIKALGFNAAVQSLQIGRAHV